MSYLLSTAILNLATLSDEDLGAINEILEARLRRHLYGRAKVLPREVIDTVGEPVAPDEPCDACSSCRVELAWDDCIPKPCSVCRTAERAEFDKRKAIEAEPPTERSPSYHRLECDCAGCLTVAETGIETRDPFDLEPDPIVLTEAELAEAHRRNSKGWTGPIKETRDLWEDK